MIQLEQSDLSLCGLQYEVPSMCYIAPCNSCDKGNGLENYIRLQTTSCRVVPGPLSIGTYLALLTKKLDQMHLASQLISHCDFKGRVQLPQFLKVGPYYLMK